MIRILIVDDHAGVRFGLKVLLENYDDLQYVGEAANGHEAVHICNQLQPDVVLMDLVMPHMDGAMATKLIREQCPDVRVIILTNGDDVDLINAALKAGADRWMLKDGNIDAIAEIIRSVIASID